MSDQRTDQLVAAPAAAFLATLVTALRRTNAINDDDIRDMLVAADAAGPDGPVFAALVDRFMSSDHALDEAQP